MDSVLITTPEGDVVQVDNRFYLLSPLQSFDSIGLTWIRCVGCGGISSPFTLQDAINNGNVLTKNDTINVNGNSLNINSYNVTFPVVRIKNNYSHFYSPTALQTFGSRPFSAWSDYSGTPILGLTGNSGNAAVYGNSISNIGISGYSQENAGVTSFGKTYAFFGIQSPSSIPEPFQPVLYTERQHPINDGDSVYWAMGFREAPNLGGIDQSLSIASVVENYATKSASFIISTKENNLKKHVFGGESSGQLRAYQYGNGTFIASPGEYSLEADANGNIVEKKTDVFQLIDLLHGNFTINSPGVYKIDACDESNTLYLPYPNNWVGRKITVINTTACNPNESGHTDNSGTEVYKLPANKVTTFYSDGVFWYSDN
ncbi:MAG: hypothetical protein IT254_07165 [Chitinophagaceae bacterium]|nr:hypothetical protein [Chitinophagaceae bacterium]